MHNSREIETDPNQLVRALLSLNSSRRLSVLDSCGVSGARLLIAGFDPVEVVELRHGFAHISRRDSDQVQVLKDDVLTLLDDRLAKYRVIPSGDRQCPTAACIATFSYELAYQIERLERTSRLPHELTEPDAVFAFYDSLIVHDYEKRKTKIVSTEGAKRVGEIEDSLRLAIPIIATENAGDSTAESSMTLDEYLASVHRIKEHISAGDIYQANLTQRFDCVLASEDRPEDIFWRLRRDHPAPFAAFIRRRDDTVISISPESFLRLSLEKGGRQIEARPIKGTRPRGAHRLEDARLREELLSSEKDRAENIMIVDLLRNDLGRVCLYGTVEVVDLCQIEEHPTLFHLVSRVRGRLGDDVTGADILRACFPCGSITGAPKVRAMEIINEVETVPRGLSMGAIGYFSFDGAMELNVAIRTMTVRDRVARFNVGGGIVADSDPMEEYRESLVKARALFRALGVREQFQ